MLPKLTRPYWLLFAALFVADGTKHVFTLATGPTVILMDSREYWDQAGRAADGDWLQMAARIDYRTPLYPALLGLLRGAAPDNALLAAVILQHVFQMATALLTAYLCWQVSGKAAVALAGYATAVLCLTQAWFANVLLAESLFTLLLTATVSAFIAYLHAPSAKRSATFAALLGAAILVRPVPELLWIPLFGLMFWGCSSWAAVRAALRDCAIGAAVLTAVLSPWLVRNWMLFDDVFIARLPAVNKWQVCFQEGSAAHLPIPPTPAGRQLRALLTGSERGEIRNRYCYAVIDALTKQGLSERQIDELVTAACREAIVRHPLPFAWATFKRFVNFWRCSVKEYPFYSTFSTAHQTDYAGQQPWRIEPLATWYEAVLRRSPSQSLRWNELDSLAAALGTLLLIARRRTRVVGLALGAMFLYFAAVTAAVELENYRYRLCLQPCLIVAISCGLFGGRATASREADSR